MFQVFSFEYLFGGASKECGVSDFIHASGQPLFDEANTKDHGGARVHCRYA